MVQLIHGVTTMDGALTIPVISRMRKVGMLELQAGGCRISTVLMICTGDDALEREIAMGSDHILCTKDCLWWASGSEPGTTLFQES